MSDYGEWVLAYMLAGGICGRELLAGKGHYSVVSSVQSSCLKKTIDEMGKKRKMEDG